MYYFSEARRAARAVDKLEALEAMGARLKAMEARLEAAGIVPEEDTDYVQLAEKLAAGLEALDVMSEGL